jgi:hypothetical protein
LRPNPGFAEELCRGLGLEGKLERACAICAWISSSARACSCDDDDDAAGGEGGGAECNLTVHSRIGIESIWDIWVVVVVDGGWACWDSSRSFCE